MPTIMEAPTKTPTPAHSAARPPEKWLDVPQNRWIAVGGTAAMVALIGWFVFYSGQRKEQFASRSLDAARSEAESGNLPLAASDLQKLITTYRGTDAAEEAVLTLNQVRMVNGQNELAVTGLQEFIKQQPASKYLAPAYGLLGTALENARKPAEAAEAFMAASKAADVDYLRADYLISAGRAYRNGGKLDLAIAAYRKILSDFPKSPAKVEAEVRLSELTQGKM